MKKLLILFAATLCCLACDDDIKVGETIDSVLLIPKSGVQSLTYQVDQTSSLVYKVYVYRSGYNSGQSSVSLYVDEEALTTYNSKKGTAYELLPSNCYTLPGKKLTLTNGAYSQYLEIAFEVASLPTGGDYLLPISIKSEDSTEVSTDDRTVYIHLEAVAQPE